MLDRLLDSVKLKNCKQCRNTRHHLDEDGRPWRCRCLIEYLDERERIRFHFRNSSPTEVCMFNRLLDSVKLRDCEQCKNTRHYLDKDGRPQRCRCLIEYLDEKERIVKSAVYRLRRPSKKRGK